MNVYKFYNNLGWKNKGKISVDADLFEDNRKHSAWYVKQCRKRVMRFIPKKGENILDFASGPIQYKEYLQYSKNFKIRHCVDFSKEAIKLAKKKLAKKGRYYCNNFFDIKFKENYFDCIVSLHTIYHLKKKDKKRAILKLIKISKKNSPIIIVYSNPKNIISRFKNVIGYTKKNKGLYFYCFENDWWHQFNQIADIKLYIWRSFSSGHQKFLFPNNIFGSLMFRILFYFENLFESFFVNNFQYHMIVIKKK